MPVTLTTANHASRTYTGGRIGHHASSPKDLFTGSCYADSKKSKKIIQISPTSEFLKEQNIFSSRNGWVNAAFDAYSGHHHLTIRPEDIWFSILSQINFYINAHAEELREYFVEHEGQKELEVKDVGTMDTVDFGKLARQMTGLIQENVKDPELRDWIMPKWSTTTENDLTVASILMMGSLQKYFTYTMTLLCGIPSVTLLGDRADWEDMLTRLDKLKELGDEPTVFASLLEPVLQYFVASFDPEPSPAVMEFWGKIAHHESGGSGPSYLSGWITAFCFWDEDGKLMYSLSRTGGCVIDGVDYHQVDTSKIPSGYASVPVLINDNGSLHKTRIVAGLIGIQASSSGKMMDKSEGHADRKEYKLVDGGYVPVDWVPPEPTEQPGLDSLQPLSGWIMYEVGEEVDSGNDHVRKWSYQ